jgi:hypothetical protein
MLQIDPAGHGLPVAQLWATHMAPTHDEPAGQLAQAPTGTQEPFWHVEPAGQGAPLAQLVAPHTPPTHIEPAGQGCVSSQPPPLTGLQAPCRHTVLAGQASQPPAGWQTPVASHVDCPSQSTFVVHG